MVPMKDLYMHVSKLIERMKKDFPCPSNEDVFDTLINKDPPLDALLRKIDTEAISVVDEMVNDLSFYQISYIQFAQSMMRNKLLQHNLFFKPVYDKSILDLTEKLKEIAVDYSPIISKETKGRQKQKKKKAGV